MAKSVANIVCCYNNAKEVYEYAKKLIELEKADEIDYVVAINSMKNEDFEYISRLNSLPKISCYIYKCNENLGYMNGMLFGYRKYVDDTLNKPRYIIMSNTDIEFNDGAFFSELLKKKYEDNIWCIGPSIYTKYTNNYDNPVADKRRSKREIDSLIFRFSLPVFGRLYVMASSIKAKLIKSRKTSSRNVYETHGCFFILTSDCAEFLKDKVFGALMYSEETFIAEHIFHAGRFEYYDSELEVVHLEHSVTNLLGNKKITKYLAESMKYIRDEFYE